MCINTYFSTINVVISFPPFLQREDAPVQLHGSVSEGEGKEIALVLGIGTEKDAELDHGLLTGGDQGEFYRVKNSISPC